MSSVLAPEDEPEDIRPKDYAIQSLSSATAGPVRPEIGSDTEDSLQQQQQHPGVGDVDRKHRQSAADALVDARRRHMLLPRTDIYSSF